MTIDTAAAIATITEQLNAITQAGHAAAANYENRALRKTARKLAFRVEGIKNELRAVALLAEQLTPAVGEPPAAPAPAAATRDEAHRALAADQALSEALDAEPAAAEPATLATLCAPLFKADDDAKAAAAEANAQAVRALPAGAAVWAHGFGSYYAGTKVRDTRTGGVAVKFTTGTGAEYTKTLKPADLWKCIPGTEPHPGSTRVVRQTSRRWR